MGISVFGRVFLNREMIIYLNLSLHAGIQFLQLLMADPAVSLHFLKCFKFE